MASVSVSFTAPVTTGGAAITSYTVTSTPGNFTATGTGSPIIITGLTGGTSYTFTVHATNANGDGPESISSNAVTPIDIPGAPTNIVAAIIPGVVPDPYYSSVVLSIHGNGTNGSTAIVDSSPEPKTVTPVGNVQISTTQSKFGGSSIYFDGSGDYLTIQADAGFSLQMGTDDFTAELWVHPTAGGSHQRILSSTVGGFTYNGVVMRLTPSNTFYAWVAGSAGITSSALTYNSWSHVALVRISGTFYLYLNGVLQGSEYSSNSITEHLQYVGGYYNLNGTEFFTGYINDIRITKGVARYTTTFTPPTIPFPDA